MRFLGFLGIYAALTQTGEAELAIGHLTAAAAFSNTFQGFGNVHIHQINDGVTILTDEVDVGSGVAIEPFHTIDCGHTHHHALLLKQVQVSVYRTHRQVGYFRLELCENHFGGRVGGGASQVI